MILFVPFFRQVVKNDEIAASNNDKVVAKVLTEMKAEKKVFDQAMVMQRPKRIHLMM